MTFLAGATLTRARVRHAGPRAVLHVVPVVHSDTEQRQPALCGFRPAREWVLRPTWPDRECPLCYERAEELGGGAS